MVKLNMKGGLKNMAEDKVKEIAKTLVRLRELGVDTSAVEPTAEETEAEVEDKTTGDVSDGEEETAEESMTVIELSATGAGFDIYADYDSADSTKFKRLSR